MNRVRNRLRTFWLHVCRAMPFHCEDTDPRHWRGGAPAHSPRAGTGAGQSWVSRWPLLRAWWRHSSDPGPLPLCHLPECLWAGLASCGPRGHIASVMGPPTHVSGRGTHIFYLCDCIFFVYKGLQTLFNKTNLIFFPYIFLRLLESLFLKSFFVSKFCI